MTNVKRITLITVCLAAILPGNGLWAQQTEATGTTQTADSVSMPAQWDLQSCIDYALQQNISIRRNRINAQSTQVDVKTAKAALFPSLSFSSSQNLVNRPYQESSSIISGSEVLKSSNKTTYNGNYGLNAQWTVYNGSKRLKTIEQEKLNNRVADLDVATSENDIEQSIAQVYIQILYAAESVKVNENTLQVSEAQRDRGKQLLDAGSIARSDYAQLEAQVSTDRYQLVTAQATLQDYKLQLKQLLELDGEQEMQVYLPALGDENVLSPHQNGCLSFRCGPPPGNRGKQAQCRGIGTGDRNRQIGISAQRQPDSRYRYQPYQRKRLHLRRASEKRMEQLHRTQHQCPNL